MILTSNTFTKSVRKAITAPSWATAVGANGSATLSQTNTPQAATIGFTGPWLDWSGDYCGMTRSRWYCPGGAILTWGGGHSGSQVGALLAFRFDTLTWEQVGTVVPLASRRWANGSELEHIATGLGAPTGTAQNAGAPVGQALNGVSLEAWYRYSSPDISKWPGQTSPTDSDYRRKGATYGQIAPGVPAPAHVYGGIVALPPGVFGGGARGSLFLPLLSSIGPASGVHTYYSYICDLVTGKWRRMTDELGPQSFYDTQYANSSGDNRYRWMQNQPNESSWDYDPQTKQIVGFCTFDGSNRAIASLDCSVPFADAKWEILPSINSPVVQARQACLVSTPQLGVEVQLRENGTLKYVTTRRGPLDVVEWADATLSGPALPGAAGSGLLLGYNVGNLYMAPSMKYFADTGKIAIFGKGGASGAWSTNQDIWEITVPADPTSTWAVTRRTITGTITPSTTEAWSKLFRTDFKDPSNNRYIHAPTLVNAPQVIN